MCAMEKIIVLDFGGQYNQLIARRVRQFKVYSEILAFNHDLSVLSDPDVKGIIFTGGPNSVYAEGSPTIDKKIFEIGKPILGICYGAQLMAHLLGGEVGTAEKGEYGPVDLHINNKSDIFESVNKELSVFMSHRDQVNKLPEGFTRTASTDTCPNAAFSNEAKHLYAVQFHPEVTHTEQGLKMLENFVLGVCGAKQEWDSSYFVNKKIKEIKEKVGDHKVICALSGGVDSAVTAALLEKSLGDQVICYFIDHGLMRKNEGDEVEAVFGEKSRFKLHFNRLNKGDLFLGRLAGVNEPEKKRKIIGKTFIDCFGEALKDVANGAYLAQGTIYPDRVESGLGASATIKSHHNVGGLPKDLPFIGLVEPLDELFKDEVREVGYYLGLPASLVERQPFPGPGLATRIVGEVTPDKVRIVQEADYIFREEIAKSGIKPAQYFAALSNMKSVGVKGDERSYDYSVVLRAVDTDDFMTAKPTKIPYEVLTLVADRIVNEVRGVNRVLFDFTTKPPATIELE